MELLLLPSKISLVRASGHLGKLDKKVGSYGDFAQENVNRLENRLFLL
jgi:hypothetical protein